MTQINFHQHPFAGQEPQVFHAESLAQWFVERYEGRDRPDLLIFAGEPSEATRIPVEPEAILACDAPVYTVLEMPGLPAPIVTFLWQFAISYVIGRVITAMTSQDPSALESHTQESPNNQLSDRQNRVRMMERVEDIYGTVRSIPSLMMPTYNKYIDHRKVEYGYYCITRGYADVTDIRDGDTLLSEIDGASARVYLPFASPNVPGSHELAIGDPIIDPILSVSRSISIDGIVLKAANQLQVTPNLPYFFRGPGSESFFLPVTTTADVIYQPTLPFNSRRPNFASVAVAGQTITIAMADRSVTRGIGTLTAVSGTKTFTSDTTGVFRGLKIGQTITFPGFALAANQTPKTVVSHTGESVTVAEALADEVGTGPNSLTFDINYSGTRTIASVDNGYITLTGAPQFDETAPEDGTAAITATITISNDLVDWTGWITLPSTSRTEIWTNVVARGGMFKDDGAKSTASVSYEVQIERLNGSLTPVGQVETISGSLTGAASVERAETLEQVTAWTGPARVRARRITPYDYDFQGFVQDEITWMDLYAVSPVSKVHFGNKTTIHTVTRSTTGSTSVRRRELNCLASRKLPTYNGTTFSGTLNSIGQLSSGTISATSKIVDIIAAIAADPKIGRRDISTDLDLAQIWATQQALDAWNPQCGQFNFTLDSDSISFEETLQAVANAAFCVAYRQNGKIRLWLDRPQSAPVALFSHRNKKPRAETITRTFASDSEYDGVELVYVDPVTEKRETIRLPLDGSYTRLKKVETVGIRSYEQAWFRANREYRRLIGQRLSIDMEVTTDARALYPGARIANVDNTRFKAYDGEVVGWDAVTKIATLSCDVAFLPATAHSILLQKRDGSLQSISCTAGALPNQVVLAIAPTEALVTTPTNEDGIRTVFSFAADSARAAQAWLVQEISATDDNYVRIRAVNYADSYYAADSLAIPNKAGVIN